MAPNSKSALLEEPKFDQPITAVYEEKITKPKVEQPIIWRNVIAISLFHLVALVTPFYCWSRCKYNTIFWGIMIGSLGGFGVTGGVHRLWAHRSYSAKWPLRLILLLCYSIAGQNSVLNWVRDHRVHHKFSETDADPHNSQRGFFFAHVGWLFLRKHPLVIEKGRTVDMSDVMADPLVMFHEKHFIWFKLIMCFIVPTLVPCYFWGEPFFISFLIMNFLRYILALNFTWAVNSAAHIWGNKPFDGRIMPAENRVVSFLALGEGWHNYHHVFPWDYKTAELGHYSTNWTTLVIDWFAWMGWAYDLKTVSPAVVTARVKRTGDGTHDVWGWGDKDMSLEEKLEATVLNGKKVE
uniref:Acyl-CoA Delta(11) desaturase n=2 Tax=Cacopsylla melanoneura TaxID=428564 RepID=A0A8D8UZZ2_9HEMI